MEDDFLFSRDAWETTFRTKLEDVLDKYFPKIEEEGEKKVANKRSQALVLYAEAVVLARGAYEAGLRETAIKLDKNMAEWLKGTDEASKEVIEAIRKEERARIMERIIAGDTFTLLREYKKEAVCSPASETA